MYSDMVFETQDKMRVNQRLIAFTFDIRCIQAYRDFILLFFETLHHYEGKVIFRWSN